MGTINWLTPEEHGAWDAFVARHPMGSVYQLSSWHRVLETAFRHIRGRFLVLRDESGQIQAGLPVYQVKSWLLKNRTVSIPFASVCDPLVSSREEFALLWREIEKISRSHKSKRVEIRTRWASRDFLPTEMTIGAKCMHHYLPLNKSTTELFRSFHDSCVRRRVKRAQQAGAVIEERQDEESLRAFHAIMVATRRRLSLPPMPYAFFEAMFRCLVPNHAKLYMVVHRGQAVGGALFLNFKGEWTAEYSGHADEAPPGADQLVYWHAIQQAHDNGARSFSFGRTSLDNGGLLEYKRRWATVEEELTDYVWYPGHAPAWTDRSSQTTRGSMRAAIQQLLRHSPSAVQKAIGDFSYRHMG
ncbi:MAG TPA: GNAT family N-acetyltransferase [Terracidiphilus sp.]|nr:GNAT family N-acetyltransferase [Terracidiphilus sp.]